MFPAVRDGSEAMMTMLAGALAFALTAAHADDAARQPAAPSEPPARISERQQERIAQQDRLIACNRQAREAGLRAAARQEFIRECLKGSSAAAGGSRK